MNWRTKPHRRMEAARHLGPRLLFLWAVAVVPNQVQGDSIGFDCEALTSAGRGPFSSLPADFNGDGRVDLAVSYIVTDTVVVFLNRGDRKFEAHQTLEVGDVPRMLRAGDIDEDGDLDLTVSNASMTNDVVLLIGDGKGSFTKGQRLRSGESPFDAPLADVDGDRHLDLIIVNESNNPVTTNKPGRVTVLRGNGDGSFAAPENLEAGRHPAQAEVADFDGRDGPDLAVCNWLSDDVSLFLNDGKGAMHAEKRIAYGGKLPYSLFAGDFDRDGKADIAVGDMGNRAVRVLYGDGKGAFPRIKPYPAGGGVRGVTGVDLNGDSRIDLATANTGDNDVSLLLGKKDGSFDVLTKVRVGDGPRSVTAADLDGDGLADLVVANVRGHDVSLLFQTRGEAKVCTSVIRPR